MALPTSSELGILQVLWDRGPSTVREVYRTLSRDRDIGYSTVLKLMQIMTEKGSVVRDESVRPQVYRPAHPQRQTQRSMLRDLVARAFGGSPASLIMQALEEEKATPEQRRHIREALDALEVDGRRGRRTASARKGRRR
jgi:predicted transcriptional regulator